MEILDALDKLSTLYFQNDWHSKGILGVGIGHQELEVYALSSYDETIIPKLFEGWPVRIVFSGPIVPLMDAANQFCAAYNKKHWFQQYIQFVSFDDGFILIYLKNENRPEELPRMHLGWPIKTESPTYIS